MPRLRLYDMRLGRLFQAIGICQGDLVGMAEILNAAELRLITAIEAGETGWWGSWAEMVFNVDPNTGLIFTPSNVARLQNVSVHDRPFAIQNQFYEFLQFGIGRQPNLFRTNGRPLLQAYDRGVSFSRADFPIGNFVRVYPTSGLDSGRRTLIQGIDMNGQPLTMQDGFNLVQGQFISPLPPFTDLPINLSVLGGLQKDVTSGNFQYFAVDPVTGVETALTTLYPNEMVAGYRKYFINGLPRCSLTTTVQVRAIAKLEIQPVVVDTDYFLIQNSEALIEEAQAVRLRRSDDPRDKQAASDHHKQAIRLLQGEIVHYNGKEEPAVVFAPFGSARLERVKIGMM